jgi:CHAP domain/Transglycosylase SLT domain
MRLLVAAGAGILALIVLVVALLSAGPGASASGVSPALAGAPQGLVAVAFQSGPATGIDPNVLLAIAKVETDWGQAQNGQPDDLVPADIQAHVDVAALEPGGATVSLLGLTGGRRIGDWVNPQPVGPAQEHAMGFMQFLPSMWRVESVAAAGGPRDPYKPADALLTAGSYLHRLETGAVGGVPHDLRGALAAYGGSLAYADQVLSLAAPPPQVAGLPVVFPIPAPGWIQRIATPHWPSDLAAHMSPSAVTNQCVAGALATWAMMHPADPRWNHPPPLFGNAIDLFDVARAEGFQLDNHPTPGAMVMFGGAYGVFGHIATVRAVQGDRYEVVEQNFLDFNPQLETHWATFDLRSVAWPDAAVVGFIVAPGVG